MTTQNNTIMNHSQQLPDRKIGVGGNQPSQDMKLAHSSADTLYYNPFMNNNSKSQHKVHLEK